LIYQNNGGYPRRQRPKPEKTTAEKKNQGPRLCNHSTMHFLRILCAMLMGDEPFGCQAQLEFRNFPFIINA